MDIQTILSKPFENGVLDFFLGFMFAMSIYHLLLYIRNGDKSFLFYGLYTFFVFCSNIIQLRQGFLFELTLSIKPELDALNEYINEIYYSLYFLFAFTFLDIQKEFPRWDKYIINIIYILLIGCSVLYLFYLITDIRVIMVEAYYYFVVVISVLGILSYIPIFRSSHPLKMYIIIGSMIMFICSVVSIIEFIRLKSIGLDYQGAFFILFSGLGIETLLFAVALGQKQRLILEDKNKAQQLLILQLKENENLKISIQKQLEGEIRLLSEQVELDKLDKLKSIYDKQISDLHLSSLRSQMNPHFLFNSLNSIKLYIIENEKEQAVYYLNKFSKLVRKILSASRAQTLSLKEEIETMELYTQIENIRFQNEIDIIFDISPKVDRAKIQLPSLILQPFYENAIWHGLSKKTGYKRLLTTIRQPDDIYLQITIEDNGIGRKQANIHKGQRVARQESVGLKLTNDRLELFCRNKSYPYDLEIEDLTDKHDNPLGTRIKLSYPLV